MSRHTVDIEAYIRNGIEEEIEELEGNGDIRFTDDGKKEEFIENLQSEMIEQFDNNCAYYGKASIDFNFADSVSDAIRWDNEYYGIEIRSDEE